MAWLQDQRILHRDLKPENILFDAEGRLVIADFGLCSLFEGTSDNHATGFVGTLHYMSPEEVNSFGLNPYSFPTDLWALGIMLYELLHQGKVRPGIQSFGNSLLTSAHSASLRPREGR